MTYTPIQAMLPESARQVQQMVEQFAQEHIAPIAQQTDHDNQFPMNLWPQMGDLGLLGITVSEQYSGAGMGYLEHVLAMQEISRASASVGLSYAAHSNLCINQIHLHGTHEQKQKFLPNLVSGQTVGALAISEPGAGSDVLGIKVSATRTDGGFLLNGNKMWITNGPDAGIVIVYAKTNPDKGSKGFTAFLVEKEKSPFHTAQKLDKLGMRGSNTCELVFQDVLVPEENILGAVDEGIKVLMRGLDYERLILAAGPLGIMQACLDIALLYISEREQFGQKIGQFQLIQGKIADMYKLYCASCAYVYTLCQACEQSELTRKDAAAAVLFASENATQIASETIQCLGGNGYVNEFAAGRLWRDAKLYEIGGGTNEIRRMLIGRELFEAQNT